MSSTFYLSRNLSKGDKIFSEAALLAASNYVVVLAEPGGGKTELMESLARQLGTAAVTATKFQYLEAQSKYKPLVVDGCDELAKVDSSGIYKLLGKINSADPTHVYLSSRSSEWGNATTQAFKEFLGRAPLVVRLCEFDEVEQRAIFEHHVEGEDFRAFQSEVARFELDSLLPNPQFLKLFADSYIESGRYFTNKRSIFEKAVERLAKEVNTSLARTNPKLSSIQKVELSSDIFAKLLLSGAEGISTSEATEDRLYPLLTSLFAGSNAAEEILATRLFKPSDSEDHHRPVHKIVAEYCAAAYLTKRIMDPADPLTLHKCTPIIAPNSTVRDELRGLLGWMAALGNTSVERVAIELDPYAVLANGDPSQLENSSKRLLLNRLKEIEQKDPYFRRGDFWRRFSTAGFFTQDILIEIKPLLSKSGEGQLRDLILELLSGSPAIKQVSGELRQLLLSQYENDNTRFLASRCLLNLEGHDHRAELDVLISEASHTSLEIVADTIETLAPETFERKFLENFSRACAGLYPDVKDQPERRIGGRYFVKKFIAGLDKETIEWLLNELTKDFRCKCGKEAYECDCRNGMSKVIGSMLDRYFELADTPHDPKRIWKWINELNFHEQKNGGESTSVRVLQEDDGLRQGIIAHVFEGLIDHDQIVDTKLGNFDWFSHSGLSFQPDDYKFLIDLAFETNNPDLWTSFIATHRYHLKRGERGTNRLRRHMRGQAYEKPLFMREWTKVNKAETQLQRKRLKQRSKHTRKMKRRLRQKDERRYANIKFIEQNRELVESGCHFQSLVLFARFTLHEPEKIEQEFGDKTMVKNALRNCLAFLTPKIPDLFELAELQCASQGLQAEIVLYAACLEILRAEGNLERVDPRLLKALRTNIHMSYPAVSQEDRDALKAEVDRLAFPDTESADNFLRQYVEPQIAKKGCSHPRIWLLRSEDIFGSLRASLSIEWLRRFDDLALGPLNTIFEIAAQYGNRNELQEIIASRYEEFMSKWPYATDREEIEKKRKFWLIRAWSFMEHAPEKCWDWLKTDKNTLLLLQGHTGHLNLGEHSSWPKFTARKIEVILDAFIGQWPKVDLANESNSESSEEENAYRFLTEVVWSINSDDPDDAIPVLNRLLGDPRFSDFHRSLKTIYAAQKRKKALMDFEPPTPEEIVARLDRDQIVTTEGLRQLVLQELQDFQKAINGGEFNSADRFYEKGDRLNENRSTEIIAERLDLRLQPQGISVEPERQVKAGNRCDFTATKVIRGKRRLLVTEVKGQWHKELYTAASTQLSQRYSIHPDAEQQGIFLVIWFGTDEKVAGRKIHEIRSAQQLKESIETAMPPDLKGLIDVFVLDVSKT
jgi:hypothetical protein